MSGTKKIKVGELKKWVQDQKLGWTVDEKLKDDDEIPEFPLGINDDAKLAKDVPEVDIKKGLSDGSSNLFLLKRLIDENIVKPSPGIKTTKVINPENLEVIDLDKLEES